MGRGTGASILSSFISKGLRDSRRGVRCSRLKILNISIITVNRSRFIILSCWIRLGMPNGSLLIWPSAPLWVR